MLAKEAVISRSVLANKEEANPTVRNGLLLVSRRDSDRLKSNPPGRRQRCRRCSRIIMAAHQHAGGDQVRYLSGKGGACPKARKVP